MIMDRRHLALLSALIIGVSLTGCTAGPKVNLPMAATGNDRIEIIWLHSYGDQGGVRVVGQVRRPPQTYGSIGGHLHVIAYFADGRAPVAVDTALGHMPSRGSRLARFSALLRTSDPGRIDRIAVEYHPGAKGA